MFNSGSSYQNFWSLVNEYQLYQTLLLLGAFIPEDLITFGTDLHFSVFSFGFLDDWGLPNWTDIIDINNNQEREVFIRMGMESGSLIVNEAYLFSIIFLTVTLDAIIVTPLLCYAKAKCKKSNQKHVIRVNEYFHFKVYIRMCIEAFLFVVIGGLDEFKKYIEGGATNFISTIFTLVLMIMISAFIVFVIIHYFYSSREKMLVVKNTYTSEIYVDTKTTKLKRSYIMAFLIRRAIIAIYVIFVPGHLNLVFVVSK